MDFSEDSRSGRKALAFLEARLTLQARPLSAMALLPISARS